MSHYKSIAIFLVPVLLLGASCTQPTTNTDTVSNTNENTNTEVVVNTNAELDTSDWLTYTNEEYGFSVKYPSNWIYFNKIDEEGYAIYDASETDLVRFTDRINEYSASSFKDVAIQVKTKENISQRELESINSSQNVIERDGLYFIFSASWPGTQEVQIFDEIFDSMVFDS